MMKPYQKIFLHWLDVVNRTIVKQQRDESRLNSPRLAQEPVLRVGPSWSEGPGTCHL